MIGPWTVWFRHYAPSRGIWIEIQTNRPMRLQDVEMVEKLCVIWREVVAEDEPPAAPAPSAASRPAPGAGETAPATDGLLAESERRRSLLDAALTSEHAERLRVEGERDLYYERMGIWQQRADRLSGLRRAWKEAAKVWRRGCIAGRGVLADVREEIATSAAGPGAGETAPAAPPRSSTPEVKP